MPVEVMHLRGAEQILHSRHLKDDVMQTMYYLEQCLYGSLYKKEISGFALNEMGWCEANRQILQGRRYLYKGLKKQVAIEGNFASYEYILEGLFRLQVGYDQGRIHTGVLMLTGQRSKKSQLGTTSDLIKKEIEMLYPTISMPVTVALFDLGTPYLPDDHEKGGQQNGLSVSGI